MRRKRGGGNASSRARTRARAIVMEARRDGERKLADESGGIENRYIAGAISAARVARSNIEEVKKTKKKRGEG